jgi:hypothetical protein
MRHAALAIALITAGLSTPAVAAASGVQGFCPGSTWSPTSTGQYYHSFNATGSSYFTEVDGWLTVRDLWPCEGLSNSGYSFAAAANVQRPNGQIYQVGYMVEGGNGGDTPYFAYAAGSPDAVIITSPRPVKGNRYRFIVYKGTGATHPVILVIKDSTGNNTVWSKTTTIAWGSDLHTAWWGWEIGNMNSAGGLSPDSARADLVGLWSTNDLPALTQRNFISPIAFEPDGDPNDGTHMHVSGSSNEILNVETHSISQPIG